ncbi:Type III restriction-modification system methylation subunit [Clostridiaceae bacterium JG1575]|nr:Type III restriction-modification system methylation subunit [Clostridiaceae bacterium JG1575]
MRDIEKMKFESVSVTEENKEKIANLFPGVITDGKINFDLLRSMLGDEISKDEAYEFTWVGKRAAIAEAGRPIQKTLRPSIEESKDWDTTKNLYIEGDNLDVLKLLQESYLGKVKMIYIDPPYNTGNDFVYCDDFKVSREEYEEEAGTYDEEGERLFKNTETNGRFHSDWCSMIYPRLVLARNLLSKDGVIFISIDDNEQENLKKICNEVFGESNFIAQLIWERAFAPKNDAKYISNSHDYVLMYTKSIVNFTIGRLPRTDEANGRYTNPDNDPRGVWQSSDLTAKSYSPSGDYPIKTPSGRIVEPPAGRCWSLSEKAFSERLQDNRIWFGSDGNGVPRIKRFLSELKFSGMSPTSIMFFKDVGHSQEGSQEVTKLIEAGAFDGPKPVRLLTHLLAIANLQKDSIILDFFSGSATTAHAVMQLNARDGGNRKFIMIQLPEHTEENSKAFKSGFKNICEIGKKRIKVAGNKIKEEAGLVGQGLDIGFRVLKVDESNMEDVYYAAGDYSQDLVSLVESNIKTDRTDMDLLFGCLLEWGLPLSLPHTQEKIDGFTVHTYNEGDLIACFEDHISEEVMREIAMRQPLRVVFRDSSFTSSPQKINVGEIFKLLSPNTTIRVI